MITFHNDRLVPPVLCDVLYHTVPEHLHIPVVFLRSPTDRQPGKWYPMGIYTSREPQRIEIYLNAVYRAALLKREIKFGVPPFREWYALLSTCYHEFGHHGDPYRRNDISDAAYTYRGLEYTNAEARADAYAEQMIANLAEKDKCLFQPRWLGYLSIRTEKWLASMKRWECMCLTYKSEYFNTLRTFKAAGQLTTSDAARWLGVYREVRLKETNDTIRIPNRGLIRRVAKDLAYTYVDRAGRQHLFFDYGDLPEIGRRIQRLRTHGPSDRREDREQNGRW